MSKMFTCGGQDAGKARGKEMPLVSLDLHKKEILLQLVLSTILPLFSQPVNGSTDVLLCIISTCVHTSYL